MKARRREKKNRILMKYYINRKRSSSVYVLDSIKNTHHSLTEIEIEREKEREKCKKLLQFIFFAIFHEICNRQTLL